MTTNDYTPKPIDTYYVVLPEELLQLAKRMAENEHNVCAVTCFAQVWIYSPERDDANKKHHCLFPFVDLPEEEKVCDRNISLEALRFILAEGFNILPVPCSSSEIKNNTNN